MSRRRALILGATVIGVAAWLIEQAVIDALGRLGEAAVDISMTIDEMWEAVDGALGNGDNQ